MVNLRRFRRPLRGLAWVALALAAGLFSPHGAPGGGGAAAQPVGGAVARPAPAPAGASAKGGAMSPAWKEVEELISEDRHQAAFDKVEAILATAEKRGDAVEWTRALIREVQLRTALGGFETAVRTLRGQPWPEQPLYRSVLDLFYAQSLVQYFHAYNWEIRQRERVESGEEVDLKAWTAEQIVAAVGRAYAEVWARREVWGAEPLGELAEYLEQNDYPPRIRGTLRDAVTYLWAELLADSSLWTPAQSQEVFRLKLPELLGDAPGAGVDLADPEVHPLLKIARLLADLENWHRQAGRPEAAFEARRQRLERLAGSFTFADERQAIQADLRHHLDELSEPFEWWSMGMASLAEMVQGGEDPGALAAAREIALAGARAHPDSVGGHRCRALAAAIEAPSYALTAMTADGPRQRSIAVQHKNVAALHFRAYRRDLVGRIAAAQDYNLLPGYQEVPAILAAARPDAEWSVELPPTPDFRPHTTYVTPPMTAPGLYVVVASARQDFRPDGNHLEAVNLLLGDLVLLTRQQQDGGYEATVRSGASGAAVAGAEVTLYRYDWRRGHRQVGSWTTGADGRAAIAVPQPSNEGYFLLARHGEDLALDASYLRFVAPSPPREATAALVYTDRSVYRPGQEVLWKVVAYRGGGDPPRYRTLAATSLTVELVDANSQVAASAEVETNDFGSAAGRFAIPPGRLLGAWQVRASLGGAAAVRVEEYKRPTFEVTVGEPAEALRLNRAATLRGEAHYYFGLPVSEGAVAWQVTREPVFPPWWRWWGYPTVASRIVAAGAAALAADGSFHLAFTPEADEREAANPGVSYRFRLSVDVTDPGGETRSASRVFRLGFVAVEAAVRRETAFFRAGEPARLTLERSDLDGTPRAGRGSWRLLRLAQPAQALLPAEQPLPAPPPGAPAPYQTPGDRRRSRWAPAYSPAASLARWDDGEELRHGEVEHGEDGEASLDLGALPAGAYRLRYTTADPYGATFETRDEFVVAAPTATPLALPAILLAERDSVPVGGTARLLVHSALPGQELLLEVYRGAQRVERRALAGGDDDVVEIPVGEADRGGIGVRLTALRDHQLMSFQTTVFVPWDDRRLKVGFATFRDRLRPGARESWRVTVAGGDEAAVGAGAAELLAYMYDKSLDLFAPHQPPDPLSLYPATGGVPSLRASLGSGGAAWQQDQGFAPLPESPSLRGDRLKFFDSYGIGGPGMGYPLRRRMERMDARAGGLPTGAAAPPAPAAVQAMNIPEGAEKAAPPPTAGGAGGPETPEAPPPQLRQDFAETAFWEPHLLTGADGAATIEFTVPDSVTEWNVWVHALTRDLRAGSTHRQAKSVKELLVRPYLPRFLREGDRADLKVVVNNASQEPLSGTLDFAVLDPESGDSLLAAWGLDPAAAPRPFTAPPGGGTTLTFGVRVPPRVGQVAFKVVARAGDFSDGEVRPLPVLPGRYHLAQSRFAALHDRDRRTLTFADLAAGGDPTRLDDQLVVTLDAQLFYSVLSALPYLFDYPYECTEQTLNRFLSTGIVSSLYDRYPAVARMAQDFARRETRYETWEATDPNRKMALEETPWLVAAQGGGEGPGELIKVLDPRVAAAQRQASLAKLGEAQTSLGAFPWWPGGPPSPYMTLYLLNGFSRALEFGVEVPQDVVVRAWGYLHRHYLDDLVRQMKEKDCCWEEVTFLDYVLSSYPDATWTGGVFSDDDRRQMLEFSFRHWKEHSPLLKSYLALTLERAGRHADAERVWASVMDSAKTSEDLGTYWAPEDRAWLWYNDTIETHAFALRTMLEIDPADARRHGLVQWLFLNKKLNHWKSTRATAEVIYALIEYLEREGTLGAAEAATVTVGDRRQTFEFAPDRYTGKKAQIVIPGPEVGPATATVTVAKETPGFLFASATWHFSTEQLPAEERGDFFAVSRRYFKRAASGKEWVLQPITDETALAPGDEVEVQLAIRAAHAAEYVHLRDPRGAGFEPESLTSGYSWSMGIGYYEEVRDSGTDFFIEWLPAGEVTLKYRLRANLAGGFRVGPATLQSMYAPEFTAYSAGAVLRIAGGDGG
jgi:alpha-2-macroglobulin